MFIKSDEDEEIELIDLETQLERESELDDAPLRLYLFWCKKCYSASNDFHRCADDEPFL